MVICLPTFAREIVCLSILTEKLHKHILPRNEHIHKNVSLLSYLNKSKAEQSAPRKSVS